MRKVPPSESAPADSCLFIVSTCCSVLYGVICAAIYGSGSGTGRARPTRCYNCATWAGAGVETAPLQGWVFARFRSPLWVAGEILYLRCLTMSLCGEGMDLLDLRQGL